MPEVREALGVLVLMVPGALAVLLLFGVAACGGTPVEPVRPRAVSPEQQRMEALMRQNADRCPIRISRIETVAPSLSREALQDRVWDLNKRVREHNEAVDAFNRDVERYNQMITYPDGLDRERLRGRTTLTPAG